MPNDDVTTEDLKATAKAKLDEARYETGEKVDEFKGEAAEKYEAVQAALHRFSPSTNQKLVLVGAAATLAAVSISRWVAKYRELRVDTVDLDVVVVTPEDLA